VPFPLNWSSEIAGGLRAIARDNVVYALNEQGYETPWIRRGPEPHMDRINTASMQLDSNYQNSVPDVGSGIRFLP
jgi:hypothetical protein